MIQCFLFESDLKGEGGCTTMVGSSLECSILPNLCIENEVLKTSLLKLELISQAIWFWESTVPLYRPQVYPIVIFSACYNQKKVMVL